MDGTLLQDAKLKSGDRVTRAGVFASPELEVTYRRRTVANDQGVARVIIAGAAVVAVALAVLDHKLTLGGRALVGLWIVRGVYAAASLITFWALRGPIEPTRFTRLLVGWNLLGVMLFVYVGAIWPAGHIELRTTAALAVVMTYCIQPLPFRWQVVAGCTYSFAAVVVLGWLNPPEDAARGVADACWLGLVNVLGAVMAFRLHSRQRLLFVSLLRQAELSAGLAKALAEVKTLRGLIRVCAWCRKVHADEGWQQMESYVRRHSHAEFTHGICPTCRDAVTAELDDFPKGPDSPLTPLQHP